MSHSDGQAGASTKSNMLSVNPNFLSFADRVYNRYRDLYDEKTLYGTKGKDFRWSWNV